MRSLILKVTLSRETLACLCVIGLLFVGQTFSFAKIDPETLVGAWLFDENQGDTAKDRRSCGRVG